MTIDSYMAFSVEVCVTKIPLLPFPKLKQLHTPGGSKISKAQTLWKIRGNMKFKLGVYGAFRVGTPSLRSLSSHRIIYIALCRVYSVLDSKLSRVRNPLILK